MVIYNIPYFLYLDNKEGKLDVYQFDITKKIFNKNKFSVDLIPECAHAIHSVDNLLVIHNLDAHFSKIFDLSVTPITEQLCKNLPMNDRFATDVYICDGIQAYYETENYDDQDENVDSIITGRKKFMFLEHPILECKFDFATIRNNRIVNAYEDEDQEEEDDIVVIDFRVTFDDIETEDDRRPVEEEKYRDPSSFVERDIHLTGINSNLYSEDVIYGPDNIIFDIQYGLCLGYMLSLKNFTSMSKSTVRIFKSLLLRHDSKVH